MFHADKRDLPRDKHTVGEDSPRMTAKAQRNAEQQVASDNLRALFPKGSTVHVVQRHVSASGMSRALQVLAVENNEIWDVSYLVRRALRWQPHRSHPGVVVKGAGMDMHFHLVYTLAQALYGDGYALNKRSL
jgi:hypothetical protein